MRFFLGGVPFGCDNIGDEAILAGVVTIFRRCFPGCTLTVSTGKPSETASRLGVKTVPLFGFDPQLPLSGLAEALRGHDVFVWAGATGLSDYPQLATKILSIAQQSGLKTIVWGVGMDSTLNPAFFKLAGKKRFLCNLLQKMTFGVVKLPAILENQMIYQAKQHIAKVLSRCNLIVCRDPESRDALASCSPQLPVTVGADSALIFNKADPSQLAGLPAPVRESLTGEFEKIGICISAQRQIATIPPLIHTLDSLLDSPTRRLFFIPMNTVNDLRLMGELRHQMCDKSRAFLLDHCEQPEQVLAIVSQCSVVVSSRLHLLILAANVGTPIVGISRGSKIDNFLKPFELKTAGTVYDCDFDVLKALIEHLINNPAAYQRIHSEVYRGLYDRLAIAESLLVKVLSPSQ